MWLVQRLLTDPSTHLFADLQGWAWPASREWIIAAQHLDLDASANPKNKPVPKPWQKKRRIGRTNLSPDAARAVLRQMAGR